MLTNHPKPPPSPGPAMPRPISPMDKHTSDFRIGDELNQIQGKIGFHRPILMIGEGSHRSHEFFEVQADLAWQAIENGCRHLCLEVHAILVEQLNTIVRQKGASTNESLSLRDAVEKHISENFYCTWSDEAIVELLVKVAERNANLPPEQQITVTGLDPQAHDLPKKLSAYRPLFERLQLAVEWDQTANLVQEFAQVGKNYIEKMRQNANDPQLKGLWIELNDEAQKCHTAVQQLRARAPGNDDIQRLCAIVEGYVNVRATRGEREGMETRDRAMAQKVIDIFKTLPSSEAATTAPKIVVLAHNQHVALGAPNSNLDHSTPVVDRRRFSDGMGHYINTELRKGLGDDACTVVMQSSSSTQLAYLPNEIGAEGAEKEAEKEAEKGINPDSDFSPDNIESKRFTSASKRLLIDIRAAVNDPYTEINRENCPGRVKNGFKGTVSVRLYGHKVSDSCPDYNIFPEEQMHLFVLHRQTTPARWKKWRALPI